MTNKIAKVGSRKMFLAIISVLLIIVAGECTVLMMYASGSTVHNGTLEVHVSPNNVQLSPGQKQYFQAFILNGTLPYHYEWLVNGTFYSFNQTIEYAFPEPSTYALISVVIRDANGAYGTDSAMVEDPVFAASQMTPWLTLPISENSYVVGQYNNTFFFAQNYTGYGTSANQGYEFLDTNSSAVLNNCTLSVAAAGGGGIFVTSGAYSATVVLGNETRLVIEMNATGITPSVPANVNCAIINWNLGDLTYYYLGTKTADVNLNSSSLSQFTWLNSTNVNCTNVYASVVNCAILNNTAGFVQQYRVLVENGTAFPASPSEGYLYERTDYHKLCLYSGGAWVNCSTLDGNTYLLANGTQVLTGNWNVGGSYGIYGAVWLNSTSVATTYLYMGSLTTDPVSPVASELWFNSVSGKMKFYDGSAIQVLPSVSGGATNVTLPFEAMAWQSASTYYWEDQAGNLKDTNVNGSYIIQQSLNNFTSGRDYRQWLKVTGDWTLNYTISVSSYTGLDLRGAQLNSGVAGVDMFRNSGYGTSASNYCWFLGGALWGNRATINSGRGIAGAFYQCVIDGMYIQSFYGVGVELQSYSSGSRSCVTITNSWIGGSGTNQGNYGGGILFNNNGYGTSDCDNEFDYIGNNNNYGVYINTTCYNIKFGQCHFFGGGQGSPYIKDLIMHGDVRESQVVGCHFESTDQEAIYIEPSGGSIYADGNLICDNTFWKIADQTNDTYPIIHVNCTSGFSRFGTIIGNMFWSQVANEANYAIFLDGTGADYWYISGNTIQNNAAWVSIRNDSAHDYIHGNWEGSASAWD